MFKSRPDATLVTDAPAYRRIMPFLMRTRSESTVYFDLEIDITKTRDFLAAFNDRHHDLKATIFHLVLWAAVTTLDRRPRLNRFTAGGRNTSDLKELTERDRQPDRYRFGRACCRRDIGRGSHASRSTE